MLRERIAVAALGLIVSTWLILIGGWIFALAVAILLSAAAFEYGLLFKNNNLRPAVPILILGVFIISLLRFSDDRDRSMIALSIISLIAILWHLADYERGAGKSGTDFAITLSGTVYIGWVGAYLISLRVLEDGALWMFIALPSIWIADSAAYVIGSWIGKHKLTPRLSPGKTWEGYIGGILLGSLSAMGLALILMEWSAESSSLSAIRAFVLGAVITTFAPLGDLGISMLKREFHAKNTGTLFMGHGGVLDRIDSWLWAGVLGFYVVSWFQS